MKMNKQLEPLLPVVPVVEEDNAVLFVSHYGLRNAGDLLAFSFAAGYILITAYTTICDEMLPMELMTREQAAKAKALLLGYFLCGVPQAVAGKLALLLAGHRRRTRRALAYVVLAAVVAGHAMSAGAAVIFVTAGAGYLFTIIGSVVTFVDAMDDLDAFLVLMGSRKARSRVG